MSNRSFDWLRQAIEDLKHAKLSFEAADYDWACFASQQAAEKASKALHLFFNQQAFGHSVFRLLKELPIEVPKDLLEKAKILDSYYIAARYPNGFPEGSPYEFFGEIQAKGAIEYASQIVEFARFQMARQR